jgi:hypothetical protein
LDGVPGVELVEQLPDAIATAERFATATAQMLTRIADSRDCERYLGSIREHAREMFSQERMLEAWNLLLGEVRHG